MDNPHLCEARHSSSEAPGSDRTSQEFSTCWHMKDDELCSNAGGKQRVFRQQAQSSLTSQSRCILISLE